MKLPKFLRPAAASRQPLESSSVTISSDSLAVSPYRNSEPSGEHRRVLLTAPAGITAQPETGAEVLSAAVDGDTVLLGCLEGAEAKSITLAAGGCSISISEDGITLSACGSTISLAEGIINITTDGSRVTVTGGSVTLSSGGKSLTVSSAGVKQ